MFLEGFLQNVDFDSWNTFNLSKLNVDEALLNITSTFYNSVEVYFLSSDCAECPYSYVCGVNKNNSQIIRSSTKHHNFWRIYNSTNSTYKSVTNKESLVCEINTNIGEFGIYDFVINEKKCDVRIRKNPENIYSPLIVTVIGLFLLYLLVKTVFNKWEKYYSKNNINISNDREENSAVTEKRNERIKSVDVFRGFALCLMIFVNDGGGQYWFLNHSTWDGLYFADVLFPWFIWIMGVCIVLSQKSINRQPGKNLFILKRILQRTVLLFFMGLSLNTLGIGPVNVSELRILGVLQRIAICYGITSGINAFVRKLQINKSTTLNYLLIFLPQWLIYILIICFHCWLTFYLPVPGCPSGYLKAGGIQEDGMYRNCTGGATGYIDKVIIGEKMLFQNAPVRNVYHTLQFDPENILGSLTSIFQTFLGLQAGLVLILLKKPSHRIYHFTCFGVILLIFGLILHFTKIIPLNKNLWSLSFVFVTSGLAFILFIAFYYIVDNVEIWNGSPFIYPGMNSILVYVGHELCFQLFPWHWKVSKMNTHFINLLENVWGVIVWILISFILYRKRIFISV
ncbi:hypothetical protein PGB90_006995 [Kerria lacca]